MATIPLQTTFDTVVEHLRKQGCKSFQGGFGCMYRSPFGMKCAAGFLIPDSQYNRDLEGQAVCASGPKNEWSDASRLIHKLGHNVSLVSDLQDAHDGVPVDSWETEFQLIAGKHNLTYTPPSPVPA